MQKLHEASGALCKTTINSLTINVDTSRRGRRPPDELADLAVLPPVCLPPAARLPLETPRSPLDASYFVISACLDLLPGPALPILGIC